MVTKSLFPHDERLQTLIKAVVVGVRVAEPSSRGGGEQSPAFADTTPVIT